MPVTPALGRALLLAPIAWLLAFEAIFEASVWLSGKLGAFLLVFGWMPLSDGRVSGSDAAMLAKAVPIYGALALSRRS